MGRPRIYTDEERVLRNKESVKKWMEAHKDRVKEYQDKYRKKRYLNDPEFKKHRIEYSKEYYQKHKEKYAEYYKDYYQKHKDKPCYKLKKTGIK